MLKYRLVWSGWVGLILFVLSAWPLSLMFLEWFVYGTAVDRYVVEKSYSGELNADPFEDPYNPGFRLSGSANRPLPSKSPA